MMSPAKKSPSRLTNEHLVLVEARLRARRAELAGTVSGEIAALNDPLSTDLPAMEAAGDREAAASGIRDIATSLSQAHRLEFEAIDAALARIAAGEYGACESCSEPIGADRLLAQPIAARCVKCQSAAERGTSRASL